MMHQAQRKITDHNIKIVDDWQIRAPLLTVSCVANRSRAE